MENDLVRIPPPQVWNFHTFFSFEGQWPLTPYWTQLHMCHVYNTCLVWPHQGHIKFLPPSSLQGWAGVSTPTGDNKWPLVLTPHPNINTWLRWRIVTTYFQNCHQIPASFFLPPVSGVFNARPITLQRLQTQLHFTGELTPRKKCSRRYLDI